MNRGALRAFMVKELRHILRDRQTLTILLLMPLVQVVLFGFALRSDVRNIRVAVVDADPDYATIALRQRFTTSGRFTIVSIARTRDVIEPFFRRGDADLALVFEPGFGNPKFTRKQRRQVCLAPIPDVQITARRSRKRPLV